MFDNRQTAWAVIQTGCITPAAEPVPYTTESGERVPAILFVHSDRAKAVRQQKRILSKFSRIENFVGGEQRKLTLSTPILGVIEIEMVAAKPRKPKEETPSANGDTSTIPSTPEPSATAAEPPALGGRKRHRSEASA